MDERLRRVISELFKITPDRVTDALGPDQVKAWNSLGHLSLVNALEEEFGITFEDSDLTEMENVGRIRDILRLRGAAA